MYEYAFELYDRIYEITTFIISEIVNELDTLT